jgi:hypothetical protein
VRRLLKFFPNQVLTSVRGCPNINSFALREAGKAALPGPGVSGALEGKR